MTPATRLHDLGLDGASVSRETHERLEAYCELLLRWNKTINLVSRAEVQDVWSRHIADSAQIYRFAPENAQTWCDLGSGGGLPGVVCAILARQFHPQRHFTLIESNGRKAAFLQEASRELDLDLHVKAERIDAVELAAQDVISARALADLSNLLKFAYRFCHSESVLLFPKGQSYESELTRARTLWQMTVSTHPSGSGSDGVVLEITGMNPAK